MTKITIHDYKKALEIANDNEENCYIVYAEGIKYFAIASEIEISGHYYDCETLAIIKPTN